MMLQFGAWYLPTMTPFFKLGVSKYKHQTYNLERRFAVFRRV